MATISVSNITQFNSAKTTAVAGDVVEVAAGTYLVTGTSNRFTNALNFTNSGSSGNPIIIKAMGVVVLATAVSDSGTATSATASTLTDTSQSWSENEWRPNGAGDFAIKITGGTGSGQYRYIASHTADTITLLEDWAVTPDATSTYEIRATGPVAGAAGVDYIEWTVNDIATDKWQIDGINAPAHSDTGHVVLQDTTGCKIEGFDINGSRAFYSDNYNCIRLEDAVSCTIKNNWLSGARHTSNTSHNGAGIMTYRMTNSTIEHNEIDDCGSCINIKGEGVTTQSGNTIRYNYLRDSENGIRIDNSTGETQSAFYQNVIVDMTNEGSAINLGSAVSNWDIYNNTCYQASTSSSGFFINTGCVRTNVQHRDNIYAGFSTAIALGDIPSVDAEDDYDYDHVYVGTRFGSFNGGNKATRTDFSTDTGGKETNGGDGAPGFTNTSSLPSGLALAGGGSGLTSSSTSGVVGAYLLGTEEIGVQSELDEVVVAATLRPNASSIKRRREALH